MSEISELQRAVDELSVLNDIATATHVSMSVESIAGTIVERCSRYLQASQGAIFLMPDESEEQDDFQTYVRATGATDADLPLHLSESLKGWMIRNRKMVKCDDPATDERFAAARFSEQGIHSFLAVPLLERGALIGLLVMFNKTGGHAFDDVDARFLGIVGGQIARVIENARLFERENQFVARIQQLRMESLTQLVAGVAHEMNTPLGAVTASTDAVNRAATQLAATLDSQHGDESAAPGRDRGPPEAVRATGPGGDTVDGPASVSR